ncbi:NAD(P)H-binding protein [Actinoplanes utahensis]|uniref:NmrA family transcriptional regulator n=1 Tax=Actinoplanes utahensis TaxID=1869 RepID=A0A0A6URE4_ACTUT|nr:NAD(P)H-binding protein [Actinoplanes utahensis]KHD77598.1 NmrA family transcriptional regulator [Actinoplanes utahensis]GIF32593.1 nucleotide-diphosphate-sugar epimerase [Actinoplanes utahensis]
MILVTGATGTVGRHLTRLLHDGGHPVRAMTRGGSGPLPAGVEVAYADFTDPVSLRRAVAGVRAVFLLTAPPVPGPGFDRDLLDAAREAGVATVVKLSAIGTGEEFAGATVGAWHLAAEEAVRDSGLSWTILRPSSFASNTLHWAGAIRAGQPVPNLTGDGRQGVIDPADIAAVAAAALTGPGHDGRTYTLTGPELLSVPEQAGILAEVIGRPVATTAVDSVPGLPPEAVLGSAWARAGHNAVLTDHVRDVLGRSPTRFREWAEACFRDRVA